MHRIYPYIVLFLVAISLQIFVFNQIVFLSLINPLVYIIFLMLLPIETPKIYVLLLAILLGVVMDWSMGAAGLNSIATIFVGFVRLNLFTIICGKERVLEGGVPSVSRLGMGDYISYMLLFIALHHVVYFAFEALTISNFLYIVLRMVTSMAATTLFVLLLSRLFTSKYLK